MAQENQDGGLIRRYLLGQLSEDEMQRLEEKMMADNEFFNLVLVTEDEMIEEFVQGELPENDRAGFEASFLSTEEGRQKVAYATALSKYVKDCLPAADVIVPVRNERVASDSAPEIPPTKGRLTEAPVVDKPIVDEPSNRSPVPRPAWWRRPALAPYLAAAAAVIVIGVGLGIWQLISPSEVSKGSKTLAYAYREQRPLEARISGFDYAPVSTTRGGEPKVDKTARTLAESILLDAVMKHPSAATHHAAGRLYLAEKKFEEATEQFEEALKDDPKNAELHSDYGSLLLEIGKAEHTRDQSGKSLETFARSLEHLTKAIELDGTVLQALYNRALLYQEMMLPRESENDWRQYLEKDPNSRWSDEAKQHLKVIEEQRSRTSQTADSLFDEFLSAYRVRNDDRAWEALSRCYVRAGNFISERLIDNYLESLTRDEHNRANDVLNALTYAGELQSGRGGDRFTLDLAGFYRASASRNRESLIEARVSVRLAQKLIAQSDMHKALETYAQAKRSFENIGDRGEARLAEYWSGICASQSNPELGIPTFEHLAEACKGHDYKSLEIRCLNGLANSHLSLNSYSKAISVSEPSLTLARHVQDSYGCALALSHLIGAYKPLGNFDECLNYIQGFLELANSNALEPVQACLCYAQTAWVLNACDLNMAALVYQKAALEMALELKELTMICTSYVHLAMIEARLKDYSEALISAHRALEIAGERVGEPAGLKMKAYALLHLGSIYRQSGNFDAAIANYNQSIVIYQQIGFPAFVYLAQKGLFSSLASSGKISLAKEELDRTISYYESQRAKITEQSNRDSFFDLEQNVYDLAIEFASVKLNDARLAFEYSELSRGRSLLAALKRGEQTANGGYGADEVVSIGSRPPNLAEIQDRLPEGVQIAQYAVLEDNVIVWVITKSAFRQVRTDTGLRELTKQVQECMQLAQDPTSDRELSRVSRKLYDVLIGPVEPLLDVNKQLFIIPDKILNFLPFRALVSPSNNYLVADYVLNSSPSSSVLIACSELAREKAEIGEESVLSVGITHFASDREAGLADLPSAASEAELVASLYQGSHALINGVASKSAVVIGMSNANVLHFATHFVRDPFSPMRSRLLLAGETQSANGRSVDADLASSEICLLKLNTVRLAVLSACQTGAERYYRGDRAGGLSQAFIAAGVPLVVASLWPVDSDATAELMTRFHTLRKRDGLTSVQALRQAQRSVFDDPSNPHRHPYYWAAFNLTGGYAAY